jgi:YebC/PmpR family DNA-binding regulatory protein
VTYEGYGPGGAAVMVACLTDNRNRTVSEVRSAFSRHGGNLGAAGSVGYLFNEVGLLRFPAGIGEDRVMEAALEAGAEDVVAGEDGAVDVLTDPRDFTRIRDALAGDGLVAMESAVTLRSSVSAPLETPDAEQLLSLIEVLEDLDDVQNVYSNAAIPEEVLARA